MPGQNKGIFLTLLAASTIFQSCTSAIPVSVAAAAYAMSFVPSLGKVEEIVLEMR